MRNLIVYNYVNFFFFFESTLFQVKLLRSLTPWVVSSSKLDVICAFSKFFLIEMFHGNQDKEIKLLEQQFWQNQFCFCCIFEKKDLFDKVETKVHSTFFF